MALFLTANMRSSKPKFHTSRSRPEAIHFLFGKLFLITKNTNH